jgi:hypothetical protein
MKITHLYTGDDGQSHFRELEFTFSKTMEMAAAAEVAGVQGVQLREVSPNLQIDFHTAPRRQLVFQLAGRREVACGNGDSRIFGPGDILLADDRTGQGHTSREIEGPRRQMFIYIDEDIDVYDILRG